MTDNTKTLETLLASAIADGFRVFQPAKPMRRKQTYAFLCLDIEGPFAYVQAGDMFWHDELELSAPIKPSREYGSAVTVDIVGDDPLDTLRQVCSQDTVQVRFIDNAPRVKNYGRKAIDGRNFEELKA